MASNSLFHSDEAEKIWVNYIKKMAKELKEEVNDVPVCVFPVPKSLSSVRPEAFVPQLIAIGPHHHFRPELYAMERYKIATANKPLERYNYNREVEDLVNQLKDQAPRIRATYQKYVDVKDETLAWIMAIDGLFFLEFLHAYSERVTLHAYSERVTTNFVHPSSSYRPVRSACHKLTKDGIIRDLLMLENQVPVLVLKMVLYNLNPNTSENDEDLASMFMFFSEALLPMTLQSQDYSRDSLIEDVKALQTHLLGFMYDLLVREENIIITCEKSSSALQIRVEKNPTENFFFKVYKGVGRAFLKLISLLRKPLKWILDLLKKLSEVRLPNFLRPFKRPLQLILGLVDIIGSWCSSASESDDGSAPPIIMIPSVTELHYAGVKFKGVRGSISAKSIKFEKKTNQVAIFHLPRIKLGLNSEVLMRNLVAYEAMMKSKYLIFTRYTELMCSIIDTKEDVRLLRDSKIIESNLLNNEIADLFNGMSKSIGPTETKDLDKVIKQANHFYNNTRRVRASRVMSKYVYSSWKIFTFMATLFVLMLMGLETICTTVYTCHPIYHNGTGS